MNTTPQERDSVTKFAKNNSLAQKIINLLEGNFVDASQAVTRFIQLSDVPNSYTGEALKIVRVNAGESGLEFVTISGSGILQLNGLTDAIQTFSNVDDTNVTLAIASVSPNHKFTLGWTGTLADGRIASSATWNAKLSTVAVDGVTITGDGTGGNPLTATGSGFVPSSRTLTINSVAQDLSADRTWNVGTVTIVSVVTANGISGSVANNTTTPAITLTLGAITPTTVNGITLSGSGSLSNSGTSALTGFTGSGTSSGTNTGNQTFTASGDASAPGSTSNLALTLATVNLNTGTFGSAVKSVTLTVNGKGLITAASESTITPAVGSITGLGTGVATALAINVGSAGAFVTFNGALGTPSSGTLTNATGLPVSTGISGLGTGVATALAVNVGSAGAFVTFNGALGTPSSGTLTNATGLPIVAGTTGTLSVARGGTGVTTIAALSIWLANSLDTITSVTPGAGQSIRINAGNTAWEAYTPGTVTTVSVVTANGVSGSVATATTTPAITLTLGAITPTTVNGLTLLDPAAGDLSITGSTMGTAMNFQEGTTGFILKGNTPSVLLTVKKSVTFNNSITFSGTDSTTMTFPGTSATIARTDAANTFTGVQTFNSTLEIGNASDTTLSRSAAGILAVEGVAIIKTSSGVGTSPTATQTDTVTHSLGRTPVIIRIYGIGTFTSNAAATPTTFSVGVWCSSGNTNLSQPYNTAAITTTQASSTSTTFAINLQTGANSFITGIIQNVTSTTFDIAWTETGTSSAQKYLWEAQ